MSKNGLNYLHVGSILILIGGILAIVSSAARVAFILFVGRALRAWIARPMVWQRVGQNAPITAPAARLPFGFMAVGALVTIVLGIIAVYAYTRVKSGRVQNGGLIAIIVGIIMLLSTHWIMGILTLVGGILCYTSREAEPPTSSKPPPS
jgi:hypothetical protein